MRFGEALAHALKGRKIARHGWNGKGMCVYMIPGRIIPLDRWQAILPAEKPTEEEKKRGYIVILSRLDMMNAQGERIIGWLASQMDMLIDDWYLVEDKEVKQ